MNKIYTVELEVRIEASCAQEAFEILAYRIQNQREVYGVSGICEPYCDEDPIDFEEE